MSEQGLANKSSTICAIATAPGRGGVGIVRVSGPLAYQISLQCIALPNTELQNTRLQKKVSSTAASPNSTKDRRARFCEIISDDNQTIDQGIALFFKGPNSFTGEDVFEFQGHGSPVILDQIVRRFLELGAVLAKPGEFSERAFLNDKMDLTQAEAIADLIEASSVQAAQNAMNSLKGEFAQHIDLLVEQLTHLRLYVESAIDFPDEEIDFLSDGIVADKLEKLLMKIKGLFKLAKQGSVMREGMKVVLAGRPNAGKSTLLNALAEREVAIVTDIAGTTRDALTEHIHINGMPLHITDTAGIRDTDNQVERIGIERAWKAINESDRILLLIDASEMNDSKSNINSESHNWDLADIKRVWSEFFSNELLVRKLTLVFNKVDLGSQKAQYQVGDINSYRISALSGEGLAQLKQHLLSIMGISGSTEGQFSARRRHLDALTRAQALIEHAKVQLEVNIAGELVAEDLRLAQDQLGEITGKIHPDELLGKIFSSFCIGK